MVEIISGKKQNHWRGPAVLNFFLGGTGIGFYILLVLFGPDSKAGSGNVMDLLPAALTALGLAAVAVEAGRPFRGLYLFLNVKRSWMSREVVFATLFIVLSLMERKRGDTVLPMLTATAGVMFVISQAMILYRSSAVPAWRRPILPLMFITASLLNAFGLALLLAAADVCPVDEAVLVYGWVCIFLALVTWQKGLYVRTHIETPAAVPPIRSHRVRIADAGAGGVLPLLILAVLLFSGIPPKGAVASAAYALCGAFILTCGYYRLQRLITGIDYLVPVSIGTPGESRKHDAFLQT
ncbi:DmsC/YnfH family molybdoenzyme membrane anchor subunit [Desulfococcus sp.]|uniref:DmsC/YnfH family molybdoenzyme membrane anchor subunit n=1 Tax=Desulfococcus sp. TaxID=2025834 RepID=UPI003593CB25